jgi:hypothetical protein
MDVSGLPIRRLDLGRTSADGSGYQKRGLQNRGGSSAEVAQVNIYTLTSAASVNDSQ